MSSSIVIALPKIEDAKKIREKAQERKSAQYLTDMGSQ